jgi:hypothetical protein
MGNFCGFSQNITFKATSSKTVVANQKFRLSFDLVTGGEAGKDFQTPEMKGLDVLSGPIPQIGSSTSSFNGNVSSSRTQSYIFILLAKEPGTFTIPPATIKVGNSEYKSNELTITVLPPDQAQDAARAEAENSNTGRSNAAANTATNAEDVFMRMHVSKSSVYENEGFLVTFKLYSLVEFSGFESAKFPEFEGFTSNEIDLPEQKTWSVEPYNGRNYRTVVLKQTVLFPQRSGKITIPQGEFNVVVQIPVKQQQRRSFFDDFFESSQAVKKALISSAATIDVKALPSGKPASFTGAVGDYKLTSSINTEHLKSNDAVTIKVAISGTGNIKYIKNPGIVFPNDFDILDPIVNNSIKNYASGVSGSRTIEYNAIPRFGGDFTIPSAEFSYFDVKSATYKTLRTDEFKLHVEQGEAGSSPNAPIVNASNKEDVRFLGKDIRYIKSDNYHFHKGSFLYGTWQYILSYIMPALLFIIFFIIYRKQAAANANLAMVRTKRANKVASKRLKTVAKYLKENNKEAFYDESLKAVWGYLSDKLNIPVSALTKDKVEINLRQYGADENLVGSFRDILDTAEFARFAPAQGSGAMDEFYNLTVQVIDKMENTIKK